MNEQMFDLLYKDVDEMKKAFHEHETAFSKFVGASEERDKRIYEKLEALLSKDEKMIGQSDAQSAVIQDLNDRVSVIETERKQEKEEVKKRERKINIYLTISILIATAAPFIAKLLGLF